MSYWALPEETLDDPDALIEWAELALRTARQARKKKARRRKA
jgi:TfoX/Sxy family transcriptional regulator of competence genes